MKKYTSKILANNIAKQIASDIANTSYDWYDYGDFFGKSASDEEIVGSTDISYSDFRAALMSELNKQNMSYVVGTLNDVLEEIRDASEDNIISDKEDNFIKEKIEQEAIKRKDFTKTLNRKQKIMFQEIIESQLK